MVRRSFAVIGTMTLLLTASTAQDKTPTPSIEDDLKRLVAAPWRNEKPEASWNKLTDEQKRDVGGKPWTRVELKISKLRTPSNGETHSLSPSFFKPGEEKSKFGIRTVFHVREEQGKRFLVLTNVDKVEYRIQYEFHGDKLRVQGMYRHIEPRPGIVFIPEFYDGEYVQIPLNKE
jgi:hypothetical protein